VLVRTLHGPGSVVRLWSASEVHELVPLVGSAGGAGIEVLLRAWRRRMNRTGEPPTDSACLVSWPSRDVHAARALLDHGFVPLSVLAVRTGAPSEWPPPSTSLSIRKAGPRDLDVAVELALAELEYSALVGSPVVRPETAELKRESMRSRLAQGDPVWLAERRGAAVALAECAWTESAPGTWVATRIPIGWWGYVNCFSVRPQFRGTGVGQQLITAVHRDFDRGGAAGCWLYYNPANPLSSVFWARQGYRPLWTVWEIRPAGALR
jgi:GNAT superfamily N-acetyltransferase